MKDLSVMTEEQLREDIARLEQQADEVQALDIASLFLILRTLIELWREIDRRRSK